MRKRPGSPARVQQRARAAATNPNPLQRRRGQNAAGVPSQGQNSITCPPLPPSPPHTHQMCSDRKAARPRFFAAVSHSGSEGPSPAPPPPPTWPTPSSRHFPGEHRLLHPSPAQAGGGGEGRKEGERREEGGWTAQSRGRLSRGRTLTGLREQFALDEREGSALKAERWEGSGGRWGWVVVVRHSGGGRRREDG